MKNTSIKYFRKIYLQKSSEKTSQKFPNNLQQISHLQPKRGQFLFQNSSQISRKFIAKFFRQNLTSKFGFENYSCLGRPIGPFFRQD